jgi:hypothetical protein
VSPLFIQTSACFLSPYIIFISGTASSDMQFHLMLGGSQSGRYRPLGGGGFTEVGANRYERWKGALLLSQGGGH